MRASQKPDTDTKPSPVATDKIYQLKITLRYISPLIWRRILVNSDTTIAQLHAILQTVMGWEDLHLHQFHIHGKTYGIYRDGGIWFSDDPHQVKLSDFKLRKTERFLYEYDMGDFWQHDIRLEAVLPVETGKQYPVCTEGEGDCPPEDCGGPSGFQERMAVRNSLSAFLGMREDVLLVAQRLREFYQGGPQPTYDDFEFVDALERMSERLDNGPVEFNRREVNATLRKLVKPPKTGKTTKAKKETPCTSEFK